MREVKRFVNAAFLIKASAVPVAALLALGAALLFFGPAPAFGADADFCKNYPDAPECVSGKSAKDTAGELKDLGASLCAAATKDMSAFANMFSVEFIARAAITSEQEKTLSKDDIANMLDEAEKGFKDEVGKPDQKADKCVILDSHPVDCAELYKRIDKEGSMGQTPEPGRAGEVGDFMGFKSCGVVKPSVTMNGKEEAIELGVAKVKDAYLIFSGFDPNTPPADTGVPGEEEGK